MSNAQFKEKDYSKYKEKELIKELNLRDKSVFDLNIKIEELSKNNKSSELKKQNAELIDIITNTNNVYLYEIFENRYIKDKNYFNDVDIDDKTTSKIENSIVLVNTILAGKNCSSQDRSMGEKVLKLRTNYLKFIELEKEYQNVIKEKSNEQNTANLVSKLDVLQFDVDSKLDKRKQEYLGLLKNYSKYTCELNKDIAKLLKNPKQDNPLVENAYEKLKQNSGYKNYPYFIKIIDKVKNNHITYVENDDLPCLEKVEQKQNETVKDVQKTNEEKKQ
ncbi:hypothetical protein B0A58_15885 [Flavobacterium branchiophilum NBRC 15030 = ATCC 35035]|nr:hypothetical protein B0A58_15885 [Flavobacterium branchiophilum NBRC 15030 = ATCC 35035]